MSIESGPPSATRLSLLERACRQDESAWVELVDLYGPLITRWCQRYRVSAEGTADCVQDVFASLSQSLHRYSSRGVVGGFRGWLWTITRNKLRDTARREARHVPPVGGSSALADLHAIAQADDIPDEAPFFEEDLRELSRRALLQIESSFEPQTWRAFWRTAIDGLPTDVVAQELGVSPAAVRQARSRILRRLRLQLGDAG